jgi:hypothetical protein
MTLNDAMSFHDSTATAQDGTSTSNGVRLHGQGRLDSDAERGSHHGCYQCGAGILMYLSDRDHMLTRSSYRLALPEEAGACAVMALERLPADFRHDGGVARVSNPSMIKEIQVAVTIPAMAKTRIGHFVKC